MSTRTREPRRLRGRAAVALFRLAANACYSYVPLAPSATPARGATTRVELSTPIDVPLDGFTANNITLMHGELIRMDTSQLALSAAWLRGRGNVEFAAEGETVTVPRNSITSLAEKRFSLGKTALFVGGIVAAALAIQGAFHPLGGGGGSDGGGTIY